MMPEIWKRFEQSKPDEEIRLTPEQAAAVREEAQRQQPGQILNRRQRRALGIGKKKRG